MIHHGRITRVLVLFPFSFVGCGSEASIDLVISGVSVVDVEGGAVQPNQIIEIDAGRVLDVKQAGSGALARARTYVDGQGKYAVPGLWDMHVHALWDSSVAWSFLPAFTRAGVVGVRDMGGDLDVLRRVRAATESESWTWPRVIAAGPVLDGPAPVDPSISVGVATEDEARRAVDELALHQVDFIKVYTVLPRAAYFAVLGRAREIGLPVVGHVPAEVSITEAVEAGQIGIEHLRDEVQPICHDSSPQDCEALIQRFRELGVHNTPTLSVLQAKSIPGYRVSGSPAAPSIPEVVERYWSSSEREQRARPAEYFARRRDRFSEESRLVGKLHQAGAQILAGSDAGNPFIYPGWSLHRELALLVDAGLTARDALLSATLRPAQFLGIADSIGEVRKGFAADIVLLDADPLEDIVNVGRVSEVVIRGRLLGLSGRRTAGEVRGAGGY